MQALLLTLVILAALPDCLVYHTSPLGGRMRLVAVSIDEYVLGSVRLCVWNHLRYVVGSVFSYGMT